MIKGSEHIVLELIKNSLRIVQDWCECRAIRCVFNKRISPILSNRLLYTNVQKQPIDAEDT